ncbi:uncharacterized protein [Pocillopora verrucosa]|uniref:uncharacterized protein isoform X2 n=1 Tax=Pocillopora verrucosa TaxID=203993 RepID=UPI0027970746|nr:uncharacterized protein LOC131782072 isoform X2 [Pocillopora verrucosa]
MTSQILIFFLPGIWCSPMPRCRPTDFTEFTVNMESMARQHKAKRFLLITENLSGEFSLSFTGSRGATGTKFVLRRECSGQNLVYSFKPYKKPDFIIAVEDEKLVVKSASTVTDNKLKFQKRNIAMTYFDSDRNSAVSMEYSALMSLSTPRAVIKSNRSGKVFLDKKKNWKDCRAWVKINDNV